MDDPRLLRIITVGLVLASLVVGYFLLTGGFRVKPKKAQPVTQTVQSSTPDAVNGVSTEVSPSPSPYQSAYDRIAGRTQSNVQTLPNTGFPVELIVVFSAGALVSGWSLRKYPN